MSTTTKQDEAFAEEMQSHIKVENSALEASIDWIKENIPCYEVYDKGTLTNWASGEDIEDIFTTEQLSEWAESNGYIKE